MDRIFACALKEHDRESYRCRIIVVGGRARSGISAGAVGECQGGCNELGSGDCIQPTDLIAVDNGRTYQYYFTGCDLQLTLVMTNHEGM